MMTYASLLVIKSHRESHYPSPLLLLYHLCSLLHLLLLLLEFVYAFPRPIPPPRLLCLFLLAPLRRAGGPRAPPDPPRRRASERTLSPLAQTPRRPPRDSRSLRASRPIPFAPDQRPRPQTIGPGTDSLPRGRRRPETKTKAKISKVNYPRVNRATRNARPRGDLDS